MFHPLIVSPLLDLFCVCVLIEFFFTLLVSGISLEDVIVLVIVLEKVYILELLKSKLNQYFYPLFKHYKNLGNLVSVF